MSSTFIKQPCVLGSGGNIET